MKKMDHCSGDTPIVLGIDYIMECDDQIIQGRRHPRWFCQDPWPAIG